MSINQLPCLLIMLVSQLNFDFFLKVIKFGIVGAGGLIVDFVVTYYCKERLHINRYIANSLGFITATLSNYVFNLYWTFYSGKGIEFVQYGKFLVISVIGLALNNLLVFAFHNKLKIPFYVSKIIAIGLVSVWNFFGNYIYTFQ